MRDEGGISWGRGSERVILKNTLSEERGDGLSASVKVWHLSDMNGGLVAFLKRAGGAAKLLPKVAGEGALVAEATLNGDLCDAFVPFEKEFAGGLDAGAHNEGFRGHAEGFHKFSVKLALGEARFKGEVFHAHGLADVIADVVHSPGKASACGPYLLAPIFPLIGPHEAHDADDAAFLIMHGEFTGDEPVKDAAVIKPRFQLVQHRLTRGHDSGVIRLDGRAELRGIEVAVSAPDQFFLAAHAEAAHDFRAGGDKATLGIFGKEMNRW